MMRAILFALISAIAVGGIAVASAPPAPAGATCEVDDLLAQVRGGLGHGSPAYRKYLQRLLREAAPTLSESELRAAFESERDPAMIELIAGALAARTDRDGEPGGLLAVTARALNDGDPRARAAATRALRATSTLEHAPDVYKRLVQDPSQEVRREAAENLVVDTESVYGGQHGPAADTAVAAAIAADDPAVKARILEGVSMSAISHDSAAGLRRVLESSTAELRAAAVVALGGVPGGEAAGARAALIALYRVERDASVRIAILASIARLGFAAAVPDLESLRNVDPSLSIEIDEWIRVLGLGLQEWSLILREKQLYEQARK
jgi:HEAT repeat protein